MSIKKKFLKTKEVCKVTFELPENISATTTAAAVVGDFNDWSETASPMRLRKKDGLFYLTLEFPKEKNFQFRYFINGKTWMNEKEADSYAPNPFGGESNCVLSTHQPDTNSKS